MTDRLPIPGPRDVSGALDAADETRVVVACPPHPQMGGDRRDSRLRAVADALTGVDCACLRFDYGPWDEGRGEQTDARSALAWAHERFERVGLFGYSFGGAVALHVGAELCAAGRSTAPDALSLLAPAETLAGAASPPVVEDVDCPLQVVYGERDSTVDARPVADRASELGHTVAALRADHFFVGQQDGVAERIAAFFETSMQH